MPKPAIFDAENFGVVERKRLAKYSAISGLAGTVAGQVSPELGKVFEFITSILPVLVSVF